MSELRMTARLIVALVLLGPAAVQAQFPVVLNPSFEIDNATVTHPPGNPWNAITNWAQDPAGGFAPNGYASGLAWASLWSATDNGTIPNGLQVAFINPGHPSLGVPGQIISLTQTISGFQVGVGYELRYRENARQATSTPTLEVLLGGTTLVAAHTITPVGGSNPYHSIIAPFTATATTMELRFRASATSDAWAVLDHVQILPEPGTGALIAAGGALMLRRRRR